MQEDILYENKSLRNDKKYLSNNLKETDESDQSYNLNNSFAEKSNTNITNKQSNEQTTPPSSVTNLFSSFRKKVENSIDINRINRIITERSTEIKEIMTNVTPLNKQDLTSRLKSFSGYQLNNAYNNLTKSASNQFMSKNSSQHKNKMSPNNPDKNYLKASAFDLEPIPDDESFKPLAFKWWNFQYDGRVATEETAIQSSKLKIPDDTLIDVQMSSCNFCENCRSFLYDEEIMSGWTLNDSDLNIKCCHCASTLVPKLYITIKDLNAIKSLVQTLKNNTSEINNQNTTDLEAHPFNESENILQNNESNSQQILRTNEYTVQYLSPIVIRKEIENIILIRKQQYQNESLISEKLMEEHSVIFFNLIWYFKRIGTDNSYLLDILLNNRINSLQKNSNNKNNNNSKDDDDDDDDDEIKISDWKKTISQSKLTIRLTCMWDNLRLQNSIKTYETPLYISWLNSDDQNIQKQLKERLITILTMDEIKSARKSSSNPRSQFKLIELVIRNIKESEIGVPIRNIIRERLVSRTNYSSIYREILFLVLIALERYLIDIDVFDSEYRKAYKRIVNTDQSQNWFKSFDKPPNNLAVWCRRLFSPLTL